MSIDGHADQTPGQLPNEGVARREERRVRSAVSERHAKSLGASVHDVGAHLARGDEQCQRQQVRADRHERARRRALGR